MKKGKVLSVTFIVLAADTDGGIWTGTPDGCAHFDGETWKKRNTGILTGRDT